MERDLHMAKGEGETSYAKNSRLQEKALLENKPVLEKAVEEVYMAHLHHPTLVVCDLGCSSGENTLLFVSKVIEKISLHCDKFGGNLQVELQFFLNDLPGNDFNHVFQSFDRFKESFASDRKRETLPPFYIAGLPGSYYTKLFPRQSVHFFHSSYCLHWRSQVKKFDDSDITFVSSFLFIVVLKLVLCQLPAGLEGETKGHTNKENIYITKTTPTYVVKLYQEQFQKDMLMFLERRYEELVSGGQMVLTFLGRKNEDVYNGDLNYLCGLLAQSIQTLVEEGLVEKEKLYSFNLPIYGPSINEVKAVVTQSELFNISHIKLFESNWDPYDDSKGDVVHDNFQSGINVAKSIRAVTEPLFASHFGESVLDGIFKKYAHNVAEHLAREKTKYSIVVLSLKKRKR